MKGQYAELEKKLGRRFRNKALMEAALTHPSSGRCAGSSREGYERLEFLGDAALALVAAEHLFTTYPSMSEGEMTRLRSFLTSARMLKKVAQEISLQTHLSLGPRERSFSLLRTSILPDALEALLGAAYLDGGIKAVRKIFQHLVAPRLADLSLTDLPSNPKGELQEYLQKKGRPLPVYTVVSVEGPQHQPTYTVEVRLEGRMAGRGKAGTKREAEARAAADALNRLASRLPGEQSGGRGKG
ncbi:MAG TPA: ribonuclease III [Kiritimatiellae bacterium]|nr:ribonuclease III [Kiritimatiellia bacterium]